MSFNVLDIVFLALVGSFLLMGVARGGLRDAFSLVGLAAGFFLASRFYFPLSARVNPFLPDPALGELLSYVAILMAGYFGGIFLGGLGEGFGATPHGWGNRLLGGAVGFIKGTIISLALHWIIGSYIPQFQDELRESMVAGELARLISLMESLSLI